MVAAAEDNFNDQMDRMTYSEEHNPEPQHGTIPQGDQQATSGRLITWDSFHHGRNSVLSLLE